MLVMSAVESQVLDTDYARSRELAIKQSKDYCIYGHSLLLIQGNFWVNTNVTDHFDLAERFDMLIDADVLSPFGQNARSLFPVNLPTVSSKTFDLLSFSCTMAEEYRGARISADAEETHTSSPPTVNSMLRGWRAEISRSPHGHHSVSPV